MRLITTLLFSIIILGCQTPQKSESNQNLLSFADKFRDKTAIKSPEEISAHKLGSKGNPIRVYMPEGERNYLSKLTCSDGSRIAFRRIGSSGIDPYGNILDIFKVSCFIDSTLHEYTLFMDMYHIENQETKAAEGFTLNEI